MMQTFESKTIEYKAYTEQYLSNWYRRYKGLPQSSLFEAIEYSLLAGGKRLRPILTYEFCRLCGSNWKKAAPLAAAIEMIHTYSLIHDDLPCMDNDDYRRGRLTNHKVFGEAMAVLAGDALLTDAFAVAAACDLSGPEIAKIINLLASCAGSLGMVGGQVLDIQSESRILSEQEVLDIQSRKTGALIRAACCCGALAGQCTQHQYDAAVRFSENLGLAFQIRDDMLDVIGNADELGKATGADVTKNTFVRLYGLEKCDRLVNSYLENAVDALSAFDDIAYISELTLSMALRMK